MAVRWSAVRQRLFQQGLDRRAAAFQTGSVWAAEAEQRVRTAVTEQDARVQRLEQERRVATNHSAQIPTAPTVWTDIEHLEGDALEYALQQRREQQQLQVLQREPRTPGWMVPAKLRNKWPLYETEAVTLDTPYGQVTVGRSLARIFDMGGWPGSETLRSMVEQQAARFHGGRF